MVYTSSNASGKVLSPQPVKGNFLNIKKESRQRSHLALLKSMIFRKRFTNMLSGNKRIKQVIDIIMPLKTKTEYFIF
jgi:hypothetical protein